MAVSVCSCHVFFFRSGVWAVLAQAQGSVKKTIVPPINPRWLWLCVFAVVTSNGPYALRNLFIKAPQPKNRGPLKDTGGVGGRCPGEGAQFRGYAIYLFFVQAKGIHLSELCFALKYMTWQTTMPSFISRWSLPAQLCGTAVYTPPRYGTLSA